MHNKEKTVRITGTQGENNHGDPIFLLQFLNVLYIWLIFVPSLKKNWIVHHFQGNYLNSESVHLVISAFSLMSLLSNMDMNLQMLPKCFLV